MPGHRPANPAATLRWDHGGRPSPRLPGDSARPCRAARGGVGAGRDRIRGGGAGTLAPPHRGAPGRDLRPDRRGGGDLLAAEGRLLVPQRRLRRPVEPGAGLAGGEADPRRDPGPSAPEAAPARNHGLRRLESRGAEALRGARQGPRRDLAPAGRANPAHRPPAAPDRRPAPAVQRHHRRAEAQGPVQRTDPGAAGHPRQTQSDAVAVFGSDGRLRLHNEAFCQPVERLGRRSYRRPATSMGWWHCVRRHDLQPCAKDLKARVSRHRSPGPGPTHGRGAHPDRRIIAYQSRPLPDGATPWPRSPTSPIRASWKATLVDRSAGPGRDRAAEARVRRQRLL